VEAVDCENNACGCSQEHIFTFSILDICEFAALKIPHILHINKSHQKPTNFAISKYCFWRLFLSDFRYVKKFDSVFHGSSLATRDGKKFKKT